MVIETLKHGTAISVSRTGGISDTAHRWQGNGAHKLLSVSWNLCGNLLCFHSICGVSEPILIVVQGKKKRCWVKTYQYWRGSISSVSVDLPLSGFVVEATTDKLYLGFKLNLDPA